MCSMVRSLSVSFVAVAFRSPRASHCQRRSHPRGLGSRCSQEAAFNIQKGWNVAISPFCGPLLLYEPVQFGIIKKLVHKVSPSTQRGICPRPRLRAAPPWLHPFVDPCRSSNLHNCSIGYKMKRTCARKSLERGRHIVN